MLYSQVAGAIGVATLLYVCVVRSLRWKRYNSIHKKYNAKFESRTLTAEEAQEVIHTGLYYDMPHLLQLSMEFAQFRAFGIPAFSRIIASTGELGSRACIARRHADTEILIGTVLLNPISGFTPDDAKYKLSAQPDPRSMIALARINWLHSHYKIANEDLLSTLSLFILEPIAWARRYGWRPLSPLESYAYFVLWSEIARRMNLTDMPDTLEGLEAWCLAYEEANMCPAPENKHLADHALEELLFGCPEAFGIKTFFKNLIMSLLDDRSRSAMLQPAPAWYHVAIVHTVMSSVAFIQGWLSLPRAAPKYALPDALKVGQGLCPRMRPAVARSSPWYKAESTGLGYLFDRLKLFLGVWEAMPGPKLRSEGYRLEEVGPLRYEKRGHEDVMRMAAKLLGYPVTGAWSSEKRGTKY